MLVCPKEAWSPRGRRLTRWGPKPRAPGQRATGSGWAEGRQHSLRSKLRKSHPLPPPSPYLPTKCLTPERKTNLQLKRVGQLCQQRGLRFPLLLSVDLPAANSLPELLEQVFGEPDHFHLGGVDGLAGDRLE